MPASGLAERFQARIEEHKGILYRICSSYCRNPDDRDDLAQEIVIALWRSFPSFDEGRRFSTWMYRVALNVAISFHRRDATRRRVVIADGDHLLETAREPERPSDDLRILSEFIDRLDPFHKALVLLYLEGRSQEEIAEVLGITETNVATKIGRIKERLKREFRPKELPREGERHDGSR